MIVQMVMDYPEFDENIRSWIPHIVPEPTPSQSPSRGLLIKPRAVSNRGTISNPDLQDQIAGWIPLTNQGKSLPLNPPSKTQVRTIPLPSPVDEAEMQGNGELAHIASGLPFMDPESIIELQEAGLLGMLGKLGGATLGWAWRNAAPLWLGWEASQMWSQWTTPGAGYGNIGASGEGMYGYGAENGQNTMISSGNGDISTADLSLSFVIAILRDVLASMGISF